MKKILIISLIIIIVAGLGIMAYKLLGPKAETEKTSKEIKSINFNEEITLRKGETVKLNGKEAYLTIKDFTYSPAPEGAQAIWSGLGITYKLKINDKTYTSNIMGFFEEYDSIPYDIILKDSDYKTFAKIMIREKGESSSNNLTYEIDTNIGDYNSVYSQRGIYYDTPNSFIIAMGTKNNGGYSINIEEVHIDNNENVEIIVKEEKPEEGMTVTMAITYPTCKITFSKYPKSIIVKNTKGEIFKNINF